MKLEAVYLRSLARFARRRFTISEFAGFHGFSPQSSKVLIHRMKANRQLFRTGRGEYVLLGAESFLKLQQLEKKKKLHTIAIELLQMFPDLKALILYGSQVRGDADRFSDYDVLLILPEKTAETAEIREKIEKRLRIKLHLTIYSENGYKNAILSEPYIRFWLSEGIIFDEGQITRAPLPPIPRMAYQEWASTARTYLETATESDDAKKRCRYYFTALEIFELVRSALGLSYDYGAVKGHLASLIGSETMRKIRGNRYLGADKERLLVEICEKEGREIDAMLNAMGDNEADLYWKNLLSKVPA